MNKAKWHLVYTKVNKEKRVADELTEQNIPFCLPMHFVVSQWHDRKKLIEKPLFPSYIFVSPVGKQDFFNILKVDGVINYVKFGREIAVVPDKDIENLKILAPHKESIDLVHGTYKIGQRMTIKSGPFCGLHCELIKVEKSVKALVRIDILKSDLMVTIPLISLTPAIPASLLKA